MGNREIQAGAEQGMTVPFDRVIWNAEQCAEYLGQKYSTFIKRTQYLPEFPARCPIPGQPRWPAQAVTDWALGSRTDHEQAEAS
jgi:hypothetical protein